jgi:nitrate reductase delta subunit
MMLCVRHLPEVRDILREERRLSEPTRRALLGFAEDLEAGDGWDVQETYVTLFDRTRSLSLHLFEHVHGESRERGQAMVDLIELYQKQGLALEGSQELPDYIPLFLEFLSVYDTAERSLGLA